MPSISLRSPAPRIKPRMSHRPPIGMVTGDAMQYGKTRPSRKKCNHQWEVVSVGVTGLKAVAQLNIAILRCVFCNYRSTAKESELTSAARPQRVPNLEPPPQ